MPTMNSKLVPNDLLPWQNTGKEMLKPTAKMPTDQEPLHTTPQDNRGANRHLLPAKVLNLDRKEVPLKEDISPSLLPKSKTPEV